MAEQKQAAQAAPAPAPKPAPPVMAKHAPHRMTPPRAPATSLPQDQGALAQVRDALQHVAFNRGDKQAAAMQLAALASIQQLTLSPAMRSYLVEAQEYLEGEAKRQAERA